MCRICSMLLTLTLVTLFVYPSFSFLNKGELHDAVAAFDGFVEPRPSNKARDKVEFVTTEEVPPEKVTVKPLEDVPDITTKKIERVIPVREDVVEEEMVTEKAKCIHGCSVDLNVSNPELIQFAKDSLRTIPNGNSFELVQLIQAVREVQNRIVYYLTIEATGKCEERDRDTCSHNITCVLKMERHPWRQTKPQLTYQNCTEDTSVHSHNNENNDKTLLDTFVNVFNVQGNTTIPSGDNTDMNKIVFAINEEIIEVITHSDIPKEEMNLVSTSVNPDELPVTETTVANEEVTISGSAVSNNGDEASKTTSSTNDILNGQTYTTVTTVQNDEHPVTVTTLPVENVKISEDPAY